MMEYIRGRILEDITLSGMTPSQRRALYFDVIRVLATLHLGNYLAFSFFRLASIFQGVYKRGIMGNASSSSTTKKCRMAIEIAVIAYVLLE
ncbi:MAG: hypothetical protein PVG73_03620 [Desulfobacterales bacterium]|jgi:hypothetical protein